ncbi:hypothetical protein BaRGS_00022915, partial [Batillaria attramentaria]
MMRMAELAVVACLLVVMSLYTQTEAAPGWRPQGRFGKRGDSAFLLDSAKAPAGGEIEVPVEAMASREHAGSLQIITKFCTLTGVAGFQPCS